MDVVKYFFEEPAALASRVAPVESGDGLMPLDALLAPSRLCRGYLAGTRLPDAEQGAVRVGATALDDPDVWVRPLARLFSEALWHVLEGGMLVPRSVEEVEGVLREPAHGTALVAGLAEVSLVAAAAPMPGEAPEALGAVLDTAAALLLPEAAPDGWDWTVFASAPVRARFAEVLRASPGTARHFFVPYQRARSEHKFYFERWALDALPDYVEEL